MKLRLLAEAEADCRAAANWYNEQQAGMGNEFLAAVATALTAIERDPFKFAGIEKLRRKREIRRHSLKRFPYSVVCERRETELIVLAIEHAR